MVVLWAAVALVVGLFVMLPDDLENLSESVIASNMFANNVLACITTRNYWDIVNTFKPLMHTWYLGVLMQAYVGLPLLYLGVFKFVKNMKAVKISLIIITLLSLIAYLLSIATTAEKFYYLPYRAFEITLESLVAFAPPKRIEKKILYTVELICIAVVLFILCANFEYSTTLKQLLVVCATVVLAYVFVNTNEKTNRFVVAIACIGKASLSIYICHQIIVAYMYYTITDHTDFKVLLLFIVAVSVVSALCYWGIEKSIGRAARKNVLIVLIPFIVLCVITSATSGLIYMHAGVVRDVPELGIEKTSVHRGMHAEYCDEPYSWDRDFNSTDKVKIVVIGDSFGRDFCNILNESAIANQIEISYIFPAQRMYTRITKTDFPKQILCLGRFPLRQ